MPDAGAAKSILTENKSKNKKRKTRQNLTLVQKYEICCLVGTHTFAYTEIMPKLYVEDEFRFKKDIWKMHIDSRVISIKDDNSHALGMIILSDEAPYQRDFNISFETNVFTFPTE